MMIRLTKMIEVKMLCCGLHCKLQIEPWFELWFGWCRAKMKLKGRDKKQWTQWVVKKNRLFLKVITAPHSYFSTACSEL